MNQGTFSDYHGVEYSDSAKRDFTSTMIGGWCRDYKFHPGIFFGGCPTRIGENCLNARLSKN